MEKELFGWTKQEIITEVCEYMDFSPIENSNLYSDNQHCWEPHDMESLIFDEVDNMDNNFVVRNNDFNRDIKESAQWIVDFCKACKEFFNMETFLDYFIEEYEDIVKKCEEVC